MDDCRRRLTHIDTEEPDEDFIEAGLHQSRESDADHHAADPAGEIAWKKFDEHDHDRLTSVKVKSLLQIPKEFHGSSGFAGSSCPKALKALVSTTLEGKTVQYSSDVVVVGGGLAGVEAAWQCLRAGLSVTLAEMRPRRMTPAHQTGALAELVCSNTLKSTAIDSAPGLLKHDMEHLDSLVLRSARAGAVPAGQALGVNREFFSQYIFESLRGFEKFQRVDADIRELPLLSRQQTWIVATGPLTTPELADDIQQKLGRDAKLYFYDAIAPVIAADSINEEHCFFANRYQPEQDDYLNLPLNKDEYIGLVQAILAAEKVELHDFEKAQYFESCLPIEVMAERGIDTLRFGPMKPVGLTDPKTGRYPYAAIQLRRENHPTTMYSMVGFQTKMKYPAQLEVFRRLPALQNAEFLRLGSVHRNTYLESPKVLNEDFSLIGFPHLKFAGQITGVEGYTESAAIGLIVGRIVAAQHTGTSFMLPPKETMLGALAAYVLKGTNGPFQPMNANLGLLPTIIKQKGRSKAERKTEQCQRARALFLDYLAQRTISKKSAGFNEAPPTRAPSISG